MTGRIFWRGGVCHWLRHQPPRQPAAAARSTARRSLPAARERGAIKRLLNLVSDADAAATLLAQLKEQTALIGSPNQIEAVRAAMEERPGRFADGE